MSAGKNDAAKKKRAKQSGLLNFESLGSQGNNGLVCTDNRVDGGGAWGGTSDAGLSKLPAS